METFKIHLTQTVRRYPGLILLTMFCLAMLLIRAKATQTVFFFFLIWNLFLAYLPLCITTLMRNYPALAAKRLYFYPAFACWLLLLPNAPYLITDFIHLKKELNVPVWFDVLMLISFAITGVICGLAAMKEMFLMLEKRSGTRAAWSVMAVTSILSGFGVYVGRFLRYNSWDILHRPLALSSDILSSLTHPDTWKPAVGITLGLGTLLFLLFNLYQSREK